MEEDVSGEGHPEVDDPALTVRQEDSDLWAEWSWALNARRAPPPAQARIAGSNGTAAP